MTDSFRSWEARPLLPDDRPALAELGRLVFVGLDDETSNLDFLRWQYEENPAGKVLGWVAVNKSTGELAGSYCVLPVRMIVGGLETLGSLSLNTMTHPGYRKQGIFKTLAEATFADCASQGIALTIGIPNQQSYHGLVGPLKFAELQRRSVVVKPFRLDRIVEQVTGKRILGRISLPVARLTERITSRAFKRSPLGLKAEVCSQVDDRFDELWLRCSSKIAPNITVRDRRFVEWRYPRCPTREYRIVTLSSGDALRGFVVISTQIWRGLRVACLVDALFDPSLKARHGWRAVLAVIERLCQDEGFDMIMMHVLPGDSNDHSLRSSGYWSVPRRFLRGPHAFSVRIHAPRYAEPALRPESWYVTDGDNDRP